MARDYKNTPKPRNKKAEPVSGWAWLLTGLAIGLFVALLVYLKDRMPDSTGLSFPAPVTDKGRAAESVTQAKNGAKIGEKETAAQRPRFDFYNLLPEMEVPVDDREVAAEREREPAEQVTYFLQVASFRHFEEADKLRAQLAFLNLESHIQRVSVTGSNQQEQIWHRVRVGPYTSAREIDKVRSRLRAQSMEPIILKIKG